MATQAKEVFLTPPLTIAGCRLWMDGADPLSGTLLSNGATVSTWYDKSGNSNNAAATVSGATFTAASQNGNGYITFPTGKYFTTTNFVLSSNNTPTIFLVCQQTGYSGSGNSEIIYCTVGTPYPFYTLDILGNLGNKILNVNMYSNAGQSGSISIATPTLVSIVGSGSPSYNVTLWGNGTSNVTFTGSSTNPTSVSMGLYIGAQSGFIGNIYEIIIFDTAFTTAQRQQTEGYLAWKWGLQALLPQSHAYASSSPYQTLSLPISRGIALKATSSSYFFPTAISGCQLWMDATDSTTITRSGANVTQWNDKANLYTGTATNNPQYNSNPINGLPTIHFDGASARYVLLTANNFNYSFMTYVMVIRWVSGSGGFMGTDTPSNYGRALQVTSPYVYMLLYSQFYTTTVQLTANQPCILSAYFNSTTDFTVIVNGVKTLFSVGQGAGNTNTNGFNIGVSNPSNTGSHSFDMGEGIVYNSILSDSQRQQVEGYLAWKWGLTSSLQQSHPNSTTAYVPFPFPTVIPQASTRVWSPTRISGTQLWFDGADVGSMTLSGINVTQWNDKSGNGRNVTTNGTSPTYNASLINSLGGIDCTNSGSLISSGFQNSANLSFAMVAVVKSGIGAWGSFFTHGGRDLDFSVERNSVSSGTTIHFQSADDNSTCDITFTVDAPVIYYGTMTSGTNRFFESFSGGTNVTTTGTNTYRMTLASVVARIGKSDNNEVCNSYIGEIIYYTNVLPLSQQQQIEGYLAWKWGLRTSLPAGHPYINFPPSP
jgi:hypothetical protein